VIKSAIFGGLEDAEGCREGKKPGRCPASDVRVVFGTVVAAFIIAGIALAGVEVEQILDIILHSKLLEYHFLKTGQMP
jgi:hypothetical protein